MRDAAPQLISFAKSFDPTSKEEIKILTDTSKEGANKFLI
ncbi:DUF2713 family protein [Escherichia coli]|nr:DUF2713 family protein [Escherichia coli]